MNFLKQFFGSSQPSDLEELAGQMQDMCRHESHTNDCSLIQQLKQKQVEKRKLDAKIKSFEEARLENVTHFVIFLIDMERHGFEMKLDYRRSYYYSTIYHFFQHRGGTAKLGDLLSGTTDNELSLIFEELRNLRNKAKIISKLRSQSCQLDDEISELKTKLGIE